MSIETWGMLPKSQNDSETIEQAIARIVAAHNASAMAHTQSGGSLFNHVNNSIIDHQANSIPPDKVRSSATLFSSYLGSTGGFTWWGANNYFGTGAILRAASSSSWNSGAQADVINSKQRINFTKNPMFAISAQGFDTSGFTFLLLYGEYDPGGPSSCFGFRHNGTTLQGFIRINTTDYTVNIAGWDTNPHDYRAIVDPVTKDAVFFRDDIQVATIPASTYYAAAAAYTPPPGFIYFEQKATASLTRTLHITNLLIGNTPV